MCELFSKYRSTSEALRRAYDESGYDAEDQGALSEEANRISAQMRDKRPKIFAGVAAISNRGQPLFRRAGRRPRLGVLCVTRFIDRLIEFGMQSATSLG
jgi:hypothetical protein